MKKSLFKHIIEKIYCKIPGNLAYYDKFTGLHNRNWYEIYIKHAYLNESIYIALIDMDGLKNINDNQGHIAGDIAIHKLASAIKNVFGDKMTCRLGGDEFIILSHCESFLIKKIEDIKMSCSVEFSYGIAYKSNSEDFRHPMSEADINMYNNKHQKRKNREVININENY